MRPMPIPVLLAACALCGCASLEAPPSRGGQEALVQTVQRADAWLASGQVARAAAALEEAIARNGEAHDETYAAATALLGRAYLQSGDAARARPFIDRAAALGAALGADALEAAVLNDRGLAQGALGEDAAAIASFEACIARADAAGRPALAARGALNLADANRRRGDERAARSAIALALARAGGLAASPEKSLLLSAAARRMRPGALEERAEVLSGALEAARSDPRARSQALGLAGELDADAGRIPQALERTRAAVFAAQAAQAPDLLFRWEWQAARLSATLGQGDAAIEHYRRAHASLAVVRHDLLAELRTRRESYRDAIGPAFLEFADLLLRASDASPAHRRERLVEVRDLIEQMKTVELEDYFQDECVARLRSRARPIDSLAAGTAVIYPVMLPARLELLVSSGADIERVTVPVTAATLGDEARALRRQLEKRTTHEYLARARRLDEWLIAPLAPFLERHGVDTLVIVPDGALRSIPFAALHDGERFLIERYAIATAPALSLVEAARPQPLPGRRALLGGLSEPVQQHPALPQVARELDDVSGLFQSRVLGNADFELGALARAMEATPYPVVHIASHGEFDSDPRKTYLLTYDGRIGMDALESLMRSGSAREDPVELLTLSACRTAAGDERAALGLAGVAVKAGASSALATLWYVNDEASSTLVTQFYRELAAGQPTKAKALQRAQRLLIADARYRHPGYWAPFLLIGNWL